jgi:trk system potassium uptake protein TrkA
VAVHIIVVGCGRVGSLLAIQLVKDGHNVTVLDKNEVAFRNLPPGWGGRAMVGFGFDRDHLIEAGAEHAGALAAVTSGDNSNILTARIARETFNIPAVTARIYDPRRAAIYQRLGVSTVATVAWTIDQVLRGLFPEREVKEWTDPTGQVQIVSRGLPNNWCGRQVAEIENQSGCRVVAVTRDGLAELAAPGLIGQEGDVLHVAISSGSEGRLETVLHGQVSGVR